MQTKFFLILHIAVGTGPLLWPREEALTPGKSQEQHQLVAVATLNPFLYPMQRMNEHQWWAKTWLPQLPLLLSLLAHESIAVEFWLGPCRRFFRTNREICDVAPPERRQQRWGCSEGAECKKMGWSKGVQWEARVFQQHLHTGTCIWWTYSSRKVTGVFCCKEGKKPCWDPVLSQTHRQLAMDFLPRVTLDKSTQTTLHHIISSNNRISNIHLLAFQELPCWFLFKGTV